ncbi:crimpled [Carabus blaptoides fortunei]
MRLQFIILSTLSLFVYEGSAIWCYTCVSTQPGCGEPFNWLWHWTKVCPEENDVCVKLIERKGASEIITRECLSSLTFRSDIPADHYEGCRAAAKDVRLGHYVNHSIKEHDIHRNYYDETTWCFCFLDHRCNAAFSILPTVTVFVSLLAVILQQIL